MTSDFPKFSKLRILIFNWRDLAHPLAGGAEVYTHRVAEEWIKMGHEVTLFCASVVGKPELEDLNGLKIIRRGGKHSVYREAKKFYKKEGRGNFDLVIDEVNTRPFGAPKWVKDAQVIALIYQVCREIWFYEVPFLIAIIGRYILEPRWLREYKNVQIITISQSSKESLKLYGLNKVDIVPVGCDFLNEVSQAEKEVVPTIIFVGRLARNKRPDVAIAAYRLLKEQLPTAVLKIVGTGPLEKRIKQSAPDGVHFLGRLSQDEKDRHVSSAHALVATSVREGWGLVVTESAILGTVTVAYDVPGLRDSVKASGGILCQPNPESLNEALKSFFSDTSQERYMNESSNGVLPWHEVASRILNIFFIQYE